MAGSSIPAAVVSLATDMAAEVEMSAMEELIKMGHATYIGIRSAALRCIHSCVAYSAQM